VRGSAQGEVSTTATDELANWLRVSPKEMHKAFQWLNKKNVINYFINPNGHEIEISFERIYTPD
jgi:CTP-dependent riboflavin kinase